VFRDSAGNVLIRRMMKTRGTVQYSAKNKLGRLVTGRGVTSLMRKAKILKR
ncbi:unnamed protein product, partial [marine sediment metagenome]